MCGSCEGDHVCVAVVKVTMCVCGNCEGDHVCVWQL